MQSTKIMPSSPFWRIVMRNVFILLFCVGLGGFVGWGLTTLQTPMWKSVAQFDKPRVTHLGNYYELFSIYQFVQGSNQAAYKLLTQGNGQISLVADVTKTAEEITTEKSFAEFKRNLSSPDVLQNYLVQSEMVKQLAQRENRPIVDIAQRLAKQFGFDSKTNRLSVSFANPEESARLLAEFISFANLQTVVNLNAELVTQWKVLFQQVKQAAELKLGMIAQGAQVAQQDWEGKLNIMRSVQPLDNKLEAFLLLQSPTVPQQPDSPDISLWIMIGALNGLVLGLLMMSLFSFSRHKRHG